MHASSAPRGHLPPRKRYPHPTSPPPSRVCPTTIIMLSVRPVADEREAGFFGQRVARQKAKRGEAPRPPVRSSLCLSFSCTIKLVPPSQQHVRQVSHRVGHAEGEPAEISIVQTLVLHYKGEIGGTYRTRLYVRGGAGLASGCLLATLTVHGAAFRATSREQRVEGERERERWARRPCGTETGRRTSGVGKGWRRRGRGRRGVERRAPPPHLATITSRPAHITYLYLALSVPDLVSIPAYRFLTPAQASGLCSGSFACPFVACSDISPRSHHCSNIAHCHTTEDRRLSLFSTATCSSQHLKRQPASTETAQQRARHKKRQTLR